MKLILQTVYIPISIQEVTESTYVTMSKVRGQIHLKQVKDQYILSKEELIELINTTWLEACVAEYYNTEASVHGGIERYSTETEKQEFINNILNQ